MSLLSPFAVKVVLRDGKLMSKSTAPLSRQTFCLDVCGV